MFIAFLGKLYRKMPVLIFDAFAIPLAWYLAYWLRFNLDPYLNHSSSLKGAKALLVLFIVQQASYFVFKIYRGLWLYFSLNDVIRIIKSIGAAVFCVIPLFYALELLEIVPRSVLPLYAILLTMLLCSGRLLIRLRWDNKSKFFASTDISTKRVLIIGAGAAAESLVRDLKRGRLYYPVGLLDDSPGKQGMELHGVRVRGKIDTLESMVVLHRVDLIFIAIPSAGSAFMRKIMSLCEKSGVPCRTLPSLSALVAGRVEVNALRPVNLEDLLGRNPVRLEWDAISDAICGKRVLITGAGGSIGSELCRQVIALNPAQLILVENSEFNLYQIEQELTIQFPGISLFSALVSVVDEVAIRHVFNKTKPQVVFHAAAYKHVPMLENQIRVAVNNNVIGTQIVAEASVLARVDKFILISSDKAVNPSNVMGTTKRVAEIYCQNLNSRVTTQFITVRFGNVLGSAGSVVPLFQKQLKAGGPLTVTHPDIQRYFMTIPEASQLILQAMVNGKGGEIFVLDMGEPIKISYLAEQIIRLAGKEPGKDIAIEYVGLRPGEKLFEELFHSSENLSKTIHEKLLKAQFRELNWQELTQTMRMFSAACKENQEDELLVLLRSLVPEFKVQEECVVV
jgi:FlaA1/EpsC-like NDP-sugar epimerase